MRLGGDLRYRKGVVARNHLHLDALAGEFLEGLGRVFANGVGKRGEQQGPGLVAVDLDEREHAHARAGARIKGLAAHAQRGFGQDELRRPEAQRPAVHDDLRILELRRERRHIARLEAPGFVQALAHGDHRGVVVGDRRRIPRQERNPLVGIFDRRSTGVEQVAHAHRVARDGAGLIDAEHVDAGEFLDATHVVEQHLLLGQAHGGKRQRDGDEQVQPFGNHADDGTDHRHDGRGNPFAMLIALRETPDDGVALVELVQHGEQVHLDWRVFGAVAFVQVRDRRVLSAGHGRHQVIPRHMPASFPRRARRRLRLVPHVAPPSTICARLCMTHRSIRHFTRPNAGLPRLPTIRRHAASSSCRRYRFRRYPLRRSAILLRTSV